jgi:hypothetical protein
VYLNYFFKDRTPSPPRTFPASSTAANNREAAAITLPINDDDVAKKNEILNTNLEAAIVEQVPGSGVLSVEQEAGPQTRCQRACADNEVCHVVEDDVTECRCRPGFGKRTNLPNATCESKCRVLAPKF